MNSSIIHSYNGSDVSFVSGENVMVNATDMAKTFGKRPVDWLQNQSSIDFLQELSKVRNSTLADLVQVTKGGNSAGTWMHEDVAIEFARWLSPAFAIWCNDRCKELMKTGVATVSNDDEAIMYAMQVLTKRLEESKAEKERLLADNQNKQVLLDQKDETIAIIENERKQDAPKLEYFDKTLSSKGLLTVNMIASCVGISPIKLNKLLCKWGVQYKQSGCCFLFSEYRGKGLTEHKPHPYTSSDGSIKTTQHMYWPEAGKKFIIDLYNRKK